MELRNRHVAKNNPSNWFKTIDRVYANRASAPKLLIPDIKSELTLVYDEGHFHPNNSIYYITSSSWSLRALQAILMSGLGQIFVEMYSTKVSGGNLRFQAQHLRRIRVPYWNSLSEDMIASLEMAAIKQDIKLAKELTVQLFNMNEEEKQLLGL